MEITFLRCLIRLTKEPRFLWKYRINFGGRVQAAEVLPILEGLIGKVEDYEGVKAALEPHGLSRLAFFCNEAVWAEIQKTKV